MHNKNRNMLEGPLLSGIISYTIPIILTSVLQLLFNAADLVIVGQFSGSNAVAAVGATGALTNLIVNLFIGISVGTGVTVAHGLGGKQYQSVHKTVHTAIPLALIAGVFLTVVGVTFSGPFLKMMGTDPDILPLSTIYMQIYFGGITFTMLYNFCASILRAAGDTKSPLIYLATAGAVNVVLNIVFVTVFGMSVDGVALATVISQAISAVLVLIALMRRTDACHLDIRKIRFHRKQLGKILRIGLPAGIQSSLFAISNVIIQSSINSFGKAVMAGHAAAGNVDGFLYVVMNAFHQTAVNYIGQNAGAHKYNRVKKILRTCLLCVTVAGITGSILVWLFRNQLLSIYLPNDLEAIKCGAVRLTWLVLPYFLCGLMDVTTGALRGMGSSVTPMVLSVLGICVIRIVWIYTIFQIPAYHTQECLYFSYAVSWFATFILELYAFTRIYRKQTNLLQPQPSSN